MKHVPNVLSGFRILLIPILIYEIINQQFLIAASILVVSALTDVVDGMIARHFNAITQLGKVLDPIADKLTQTTVSIAMMFTLRKYWPFLAIILLKEMVMLICGAGLLRKNVKIQGAKRFGKIATVCFYATMIILFAFPNIPTSVGYAMLGITTIAALSAGLLYLPDYLDYRRQAKHEQNPKVS